MKKLSHLQIKKKGKNEFAKSEKSISDQPINAEKVLLYLCIIYRFLETNVTFFNPLGPKAQNLLLFTLQMNPARVSWS